MGYAHPDHLLNELTSRQISEWEAYDRLDPIGEWRADFRMAYLCTIVTNIARAIHGEKGAKMTVPLDFMPEWDKGDSDDTTVLRKQTPEQMRQILVAITKEYKKKPEKKKRTTPPKSKR